MICSATQCGFLVILLYDEVSDGAWRMSETGPGKPYWKTPAGSTGGMKGGLGSSRVIGTGGAGPVLVGDAALAVMVDVCSFDLPMPNSAAVVAAPTAAEAPATMAMVTFDMFADGGGIHGR